MPAPSATSCVPEVACPEHATGTPCACDDGYKFDPFGLSCIAVCPDHASSMFTGTCSCDPGYKFDAAGTSCIPTCTESGLTPLDPAVQPYEDGLKDMDNVTEATRVGAACIARVASARRPRIIARLVSGYRPPAYQTHIREVYDKWQTLKDNNEPACADIKQKVKDEFDHHSKFAHQPGNTSPHSTGHAVDISLSNYSEADAIAAECNMSRAVPNDRPHFESPR